MRTRLRILRQVRGLSIPAIQKAKRKLRAKERRAREAAGRALRSHDAGSERSPSRVERSDEAKALGITMGMPMHMLQEIIAAHQVAVFSSNYTLYGDMSGRVMEALNMFSPETKVIETKIETETANPNFNFKFSNLYIIYFCT